jgi:hypothetical protein
MFDSWMNGWREAVENFDRELHADEGGDHARGMRRQLNAARTAIARVEAEIQHAAAAAESERAAEQVCLRRQAMAQGIDDEETARIAGEYAVRHAERAALYDRKTDVLRDEHALMSRDLEIMESEFASHVTAAGAAAADEGGNAETAGSGRRKTSILEDDEDHEEQVRQDMELARLRRERLASEKLEELKRKMRG